MIKDLRRATDPGDDDLHARGRSGAPAKTYYTKNGDLVDRSQNSTRYEATSISPILVARIAELYTKPQGMAGPYRPPFGLWPLRIPG